MGSGFSFHSRTNPPSPELSLGDLPEGCVASVLAYLDPPEISRLSVLNRAFRGASSADFVWESKLPPNYDSIIRRVLMIFFHRICVRKSCTRGFVARIPSMVAQSFVDTGYLQKAWLDKSTGGVCLSISSRGLAITGIDDRRYWNHIPTEESRLVGFAQLLGAFPLGHWK
ncbi:hypothetical protein C3L33_08583, partial [Rhododendron williamsianum]